MSNYCRYLDREDVQCGGKELIGLVVKLCAKDDEWRH